MMNKNISVEPMRPEDLDAIMTIEQASFSDPWSRQGFMESMAQPFAVMLTAKDAGEVIGYCCMYQLLDEGEIINVAIDPKRRGQGAGMAMLSELLSVGKASGVKRFLLDVRAGNEPAKRLYEKAGFVKLAVQKDFYETPTEDGWLMELMV